MNEVLLYAGIVLAGAFFILAIYLFFKNKIPSVVRYFLKMGNKTMPKQEIASNAVVNPSKEIEAEGTEIISAKNEQTELLDIEESGATELLDDDSTTLLSSLEEDE